MNPSTASVDYTVHDTPSLYMVWKIRDPASSSLFHAPHTMNMEIRMLDKIKKNFVIIQFPVNIRFYPYL